MSTPSLVTTRGCSLALPACPTHRWGSCSWSWSPSWSLALEPPTAGPTLRWQPCHSLKSFLALGGPAKTNAYQDKACPRCSCRCCGCRLRAHLTGPPSGDLPSRGRRRHTRQVWEVLGGKGSQGGLLRGGGFELPDTAALATSPGPSTHTCVGRLQTILSVFKGLGLIVTCESPKEKQVP